MPTGRPAEPAIGFDGCGRALSRVGAHELHGYCHQSTDVCGRERLDLRERVDAAGEENLRLVDVADASDRGLVEQRIRDIHVGP